MGNSRRTTLVPNLTIPYVSLTVRRLIIAVAFFFLTFSFMIPIAFVQSLTNIEGIEKAVLFLKPIIEVSTDIFEIISESIITKLRTQKKISLSEMKLTNMRTPSATTITISNTRSTKKHITQKASNQAG
ncbi:CSC1/OSCA1-like, 7TM region [Dillenia turbinata]|uniref:CSC1/OSCA1-like, 7TM region n=1 Tax=Dillenia turbinata TaxID=194707 RepID=A0AAN8ULM6_9MAGN